MYVYHSPRLTLVTGRCVEVVKSWTSWCMSQCQVLSRLVVSVLSDKVPSTLRAFHAIMSKTLHIALVQAQLGQQQLQQSCED